MKLMFITALFMCRVFANTNDLAHRPKSFTMEKGKAVFVDFSEAVYDITYDMTKESASVVATIKFDAPESGYPVFDSVQDPTSVTLDGQATTSLLVKTPSKETSLRVMGKSISTGTHQMTIAVPLVELVKFSDGGVKSAFWTSDLDERQFAELYMPANFEFDQVKMTYNVHFIGAKKKQNIYTNGVVTEKGLGTYSISYPAHYTSSSVFFHTVPEGAVEESRFTLKSIDGREIPAVVYFSKSVWGGDLQRLKEKTTQVFHELEGDYGPFLHPSITVYNAGSGGMEYCGATMTDFSALGHELFHSYFARGVMPANGNSGWLDEALASWRDNEYPRETSLSGSSGMSSHPYYTRITDSKAYTFGARFMSYLDGKFAEKGGLKAFMRMMVEKRAKKPLFVEEFSHAMSEFYGVSVDGDFKKYTYDTSSVSLEPTHPRVHHKMSLAELRKIL